MSDHDLSNYIEVPDRIRDFVEKYPEGSLQCKAVEYRDLPVQSGENKPHVIYHALAYRTADDRRPGHGMASEPLPGLTPFTRGSELMNAETSAWGRALAALGFVAKRDGSNGVASANEVRARQTTQRQSNGDIKPSEPQLKFLKTLVTKTRVSDAQVQAILHREGFTDFRAGAGWQGKLTGGREGSASALIEWLKSNPLPDLENPSDVPSDPGAFAPEPTNLEGVPFA